MSEAEALYRGEALPVGSKGRLSSGWWGMITLIATEAALFAYLLFSYFYVASQNGGAWPPGGPPKLDLAIPGTVVLMLGSVTMWWGEKGIRASRQFQLLLGLGASVLLGLAFVVLEGIEWSKKGFTPQTDAYGSLYFTVTGFHLVHVIVGVLMLIMLFVWTLLGYFGVRRHSTVSIAVMYWHFVTAIWVAVFLTFYVSPYLAR
ncbi:MAG: cytochrome c oxidase subunit 3 [Pseudomonadota bacterium]|nr:cytochrome c oxidase subunit 3 [Pseudomonadota bacterium]